MGKLALEITEEPIIGNAGLAAMGELMRSSDIDSTCAKRESPNYQVAAKDILRCLGGLIGIGKVGFDHVRHSRAANSSPQPWALVVCHRRQLCGSVSRP
jgi:hypothetical protein